MSQWIKGHPRIHRLVHATYCRALGGWGVRRGVSTAGGAATGAGGGTGMGGAPPPTEGGAPPPASKHLVIGYNGCVGVGCGTATAWDLDYANPDPSDASIAYQTIWTWLNLPMEAPILSQIGQLMTSGSYLVFRTNEAGASVDEVYLKCGPYSLYVGTYV